MAVMAALALTSCGGGSTSGGSAEATAENESSPASAPDAAAAPAGTANETAAATGASEIFLDAFNDFSCSPGWSNRNGALGRSAYSGSGTCQASFPGESGSYAVYLKAQTEFDGSSPYAVSLNGTNIKEGRFPYSHGDLICDCPEPWRENCPERVIDIDAGVHQIDTGDVVGFFGDDVYPCGDDSHGAYAKWRGMTFIRR